MVLDYVVLAKKINNLLKIIAKNLNLAIRDVIFY